MGDIADGMINGDFDFYTGEYIGRGYGIPRTKDGSLDWENRKKGKLNPRRGVVMYINNLYTGRPKMPSALMIAKLYASEAKIEWKTEDEMFAAISANFREFKEWMDKNKSRVANLH